MSPNKVIPAQPVWRQWSPRLLRRRRSAMPAYRHRGPPPPPPLRRGPASVAEYRSLARPPDPRSRHPCRSPAADGPVRSGPHTKAAGACARIHAPPGILAAASMPPPRKKTFAWSSHPPREFGLRPSAAQGFAPNPTGLRPDCGLTAAQSRYAPLRSHRLAASMECCVQHERSHQPHQPAYARVGGVKGARVRP